MTESQCVCADPITSPFTGRCHFCGLNCAYLTMYRPESQTKRQLAEGLQHLIDQAEAKCMACETRLHAALKIIHETPDVTQIDRLQQACDRAEALARYLADHIVAGTTPGSYELKEALLYTIKKGVSVRFRPGGDGIAGLEGHR